ncbi:MAG: hypothetical protein CMA88_00520 [Euryarchaeota archaeon]|nr:hypothetical protein [Euryarchaeota archaeon]
MTEYIEEFKSRIDESSTRADFPEITDSEAPIWRGGPVMASMADKYSLAIVVFLVHIIFCLGEVLPDPEGEGQGKLLLKALILIIDVTGVTGFLVTMLLLTKLNHYANFSTSGAWTTAWLLANSLVPFLWKLMDALEWFGGIVGSEFSSPLPTWNFIWFGILGVFSFTVMVSFTLIYQRSFSYAITDKRIHIRQSFLYFDTSSHGISYHKVENLKSDPTILGRILGFGTVHIVTGSGVGLQVESLGTSIGVETEVVEAPGGRRRGLSLLFGWISMQRERSVMASDPADCLYGIKSPMEVYRLINELMDISIGHAAAIQAPTDSEVQA